MKFENGFVYANGVTDLCDSPVLASWCSVLDYAKQTDMRKYYVNGKPVRYPFGKSVMEKEPRCFSRDQLAPFVFGEAHQYGASLYKPTWFAPNNMNDVNGRWKIPDPISPAAHDHLIKCHTGREFSAFGKWWLKREIAYNDMRLLRWAQGDEEWPVEQTQLQMVCINAGPEFVKLYKSMGQVWSDATHHYWSNWRNEAGLAKDIVDYLNDY